MQTPDPSPSTKIDCSLTSPLLPAHPTPASPLRDSQSVNFLCLDSRSVPRMWALLPRGNSWPRNGTQRGKGAEVTPKCSKVLILGTSSTQDALRVTRAIFSPQQPHSLPPPPPSSENGKRTVPKVRSVECLKEQRSSGDACSVPMVTENDPNSRSEGCSWLAAGSRLG